MAGELSLEHSGIRVDATPADVLRIGRSEHNDLIVDDPRVSREHLVVGHHRQAWVIENVGRSGMFVEGQRRDEVVVGDAVDVHLASPNGPLVRFTAALAPPSSGQPRGPMAETILPPVPVAAAGAGLELTATRQAVPGVAVAGPAVPTTTPPPAAQPAKQAHAAPIVLGAVILAVTAYFIAAGPGKLWPFGSTTHGRVAGGTAAALRKLLPSDAVGCVAVSRGNLPEGFHGLMAATECNAATLSSALIFAFLFDSQTDQRSSLSALNHDVGYDPSQAASNCPPPSGAGGGAGTWSNHLYPTRKNQMLECFAGQRSSGPTGSKYPIYLWAVPSRNAIVETIAPANSSFDGLNTWWQSNGGPFQ